MGSREWGEEIPGGRVRNGREKDKGTIVTHEGVNHVEYNFQIRGLGITVSWFLNPTVISKIFKLGGLGITVS